MAFVVLFSKDGSCLYKVSSYYTVCTLTKFSMLRFAGRAPHYAIVLVWDYFEPC